jgi:superfamily II DNA helicase RecQ
MASRFFTVPIQNAEQAEAELNGFLRSHKVLSIDRRWVEQGSTSFWTFCVDYIDGQAAGSGADRGSRSKVDYKEVLSPDEFAVFAKLRDVRKEIAQAEAVPVYTIFTNEQLAEMVKARAAAKGDLEKIAGLGDARIEKYGARMIEVLTASWKTHHEADGKPV